MSPRDTKNGDFESRFFDLLDDKIDGLSRQIEQARDEQKQTTADIKSELKTNTAETKKINSRVYKLEAITAAFEEWRQKTTQNVQPGKQVTVDTRKLIYLALVAAIIFLFIIAAVVGVEIPKGVL